MYSVNPMGNVFILTREGKEYSDEGCRYVEDLIRRFVNDGRTFIFSMGAIYNDPLHLMKCLINNRCSYVAISTHKSIWILGFEEDHQQKLIRELRNPENEGKTGWEIALNLFYELYPEVEKASPRSDQ